MIDLKGNIAREVYTPVQNDSMSALKARISAIEAAPQPESIVVQPVETPAPAATQSQETPPPQETPKEAKPGTLDKVPQGLKDDKGEVDVDKVNKATEHLQKRTEEKELALAKFKEAQKRFTQTSQELSREEKAEKTPPAQPAVQLPEDRFSPDYERQVLESLEKSPLKTLRDLIRAEIDPLKTEFDMTKAERQESARMKGLERLAEKGHDWVWTAEGMDKLHSVLDQKPWLKNDPDPYGAAFRFLDDVPSGNGTQRGSAPATGLTPTLGANSAIPPSSSPPPPSTGEVLAQLGAEQKLWLSRGQIAKAREIQEKMDKLVKGY